MNDKLESINERLSKPSWYLGTHEIAVDCYVEDVSYLLGSLKRLDVALEKEKLRKPVEITEDASLQLIQALELSEASQKIKRLEAENAALKKERDAAVEDLVFVLKDSAYFENEEGECILCKRVKDARNGEIDYCQCDTVEDIHGHCSGWHWRGAPEPEREVGK